MEAGWRRKPEVARGGRRGRRPGEEERAGERLGEVKGCLRMVVEGGIGGEFAGGEAAARMAVVAGIGEDDDCGVLRWR